MGQGWTGTRKGDIMSVIVSKRQESKFEVFHHWDKTRLAITNLMLYDFGLKAERQEQKFMRSLGVSDLSQLDENGIERYQKHKKRMASVISWFLQEQRNSVMSCIRSVNENVFIANSIYPTCIEELTERRLHQDRAIGQCYRLKQELQYTIEVLEVDINRYSNAAKMIDREIVLLKAWRKSDNRFKKSI